MPSVQRYIISGQGGDREGIFDQIVALITDSEGQPVEDAEGSPARNEIRKGVDVRTIGDVYLEVPTRVRVGDLLQYSIKGSIIFSVELVAAIDQAGIVIDPEIYRWSLHVLEARTRAPRRDYVIMYPLKEWDVLDLARAEVKFYSTGRISEVCRWVFDEDATPDYDLFPTTYFDWICSRRFKDAIDHGHFTGVRLREIDAEGYVESEWSFWRK